MDKEKTSVLVEPRNCRRCGEDAIIVEVKAFPTSLTARAFVRIRRVSKCKEYPKRSRGLGASTCSTDWKASPAEAIAEWNERFGEPEEIHCENDLHQWKNEYDGTRCQRCGAFYVHGLAPWEIPTDDEQARIDREEYEATHGTCEECFGEYGDGWSNCTCRPLDLVSKKRPEETEAAPHVERSY